MKYNNIIFFIVLFAILTACKSNSKTEIYSTKQITSIDEMLSKYGDKQFENCDELIYAGEDILNLYVVLVDKAYNGDEQAKVDLENIYTFLKKIDQQTITLLDTCPEKIEKWTKKMDSIMSEVQNKLLIIYDNKYKKIEWDTTIDSELEKQLEELDKDLKLLIDTDTVNV